jgi:hypothetical protein
MSLATFGEALCKSSDILTMSSWLSESSQIVTPQSLDLRRESTDRLELE